MNGTSFLVFDLMGNYIRKIWDIHSHLYKKLEPEGRGAVIFSDECLMDHMYRKNARNYLGRTQCVSPKNYCNSWEKHTVFVPGCCTNIVI